MSKLPSTEQKNKQRRANVSVRMPRYLAQLVAAAAEKECLTINEYCVRKFKNELSLQFATPTDR